LIGAEVLVNAGAAQAQQAAIPTRRQYPPGGNTHGAIKKSRNSCPLGWFSPNSGSYWVKSR